MFRRNNRAGWGRTPVPACLAAIVLAALILASGLSGHPRAAEGKKPVNAAAAKLKNPVPRTPGSIAAGKKLYLLYCAKCHGFGGKGDGQPGPSGEQPSDLTDDVWDCGSSDGEIFVAIRDGLSADMQPYKDKLQEKQIWQVVNFLRSLARKPAN
jgi:mono/diheme cytochrome c family protein